MARVVNPGYTITEYDDDTTLSANTATVQTEIINYRVPDRTALKVKRGARFYLKIETSGAANNTQILTGTVKIFAASSDKQSRKDLVAQGSPDEMDAGGTPEDRDKQFRILKDFTIGPREYVIVEFDTNAAVAGLVSTTYTKFRLDSIKVMDTNL